MKKIFLFTMAAAFMVNANAQTKPAAVKAKPAAINPNAAVVNNNVLDSFSYAAGMSVAQSMQQAGITTLDTKTFVQAMNDVFSKTKTKFTPEQANMTLQEKLAQFQQKKTADQKAECNLYLDANGKRSSVTSLPNGLQYEVLKAGDPAGLKPKPIDTVVVNYKGMLMDGKVFDDSYKRGQPATFPLNGVIRGWTEILQLMPKGSHWKVYIPGDMGYAENPPPGSGITPNALLIFEIELLDIKPAIPAPAQ